MVTQLLEGGILLFIGGVDRAVFHGAEDPHTVDVHRLCVRHDLRHGHGVGAVIQITHRGNGQVVEFIILLTGGIGFAVVHLGIDQVAPHLVSIGILDQHHHITGSSVAVCADLEAGARKGEGAHATHNGGRNLGAVGSAGVGLVRIVVAVVVGVAQLGSLLHHVDIHRSSIRVPYKFILMIIIASPVVVGGLLH